VLIKYFLDPEIKCIVGLVRFSKWFFNLLFLTALNNLVVLFIA